MKRIYTILVYIMLSSSFFSTEARGQFIFGIKSEIVTLTESGGCHLGCSVEAGKQMKMALLQAGVGYNPSEINLDVALLLRIYGTREHSFNLYMGAGAIGALCMTPEVCTELFSIGLLPIIQAETFITERISLYSDVSAPVMLLAEGPAVNTRYSLGVRVLLYGEDGNEK